MPLTLQFAAKRIRKTKNCQKGYGCGNSCINKGRKCKKKFSDQASTYAGWLKKNAAKTIEGSKDTRKKLNKITGDAVEKFSNNSHSDRTAKVDKLSNDKATDGSTNNDKLLPRLDLMNAASEALGGKYIQNTQMAEKGAKAIAKKYNLPDDYYAVTKLPDNPNPYIIVNPAYISPQTERLQEEVARRDLTPRVRDGVQKNLERSWQKDIDAARRGEKPGILSAEQLKQQVQRENKDLGRKKPKTKVLKGQQSGMLDDPNTRKPGETAQDFLKRRSQDPEVQKRQVERDKEQFRRGLGVLPDRPIGEIGTSGLGGKRRRKTRTTKP